MYGSPHTSPGALNGNFSFHRKATRSQNLEHEISGVKRNHLGNVLTLITDRKLGIDDGQYNATTGVKTSNTLDKRVDYYLPEMYPPDQLRV